MERIPYRHPPHFDTRRDSAWAMCRLIYILRYIGLEGICHFRRLLEKNGIASGPRVTIRPVATIPCNANDNLVSASTASQLARYDAVDRTLRVGACGAQQRPGQVPLLATGGGEVGSPRESGVDPICSCSSNRRRSLCYLPLPHSWASTDS